jgi:uncharacterized protein (DUF2147 family)
MSPPEALPGRPRNTLAIFTLAFAAFLTATTAMAGDVTGEWLRDDGAAKIRFSACGGDALCGFLAWKRDPNAGAKIGEQVFFDMKPNGPDAWAGTAFNPVDGKSYNGKMTLSGDHLTTAGCVFGGLICKSFGWSREKGIPRSSGMGGNAVPMVSDGGTFKVPVTINRQLTLKFVVDSGAADVSIPVNVFMTLVRTGTITDADFLDKQTYRLADGSTLPSQRFVIRTLKIGDKTLENVIGSIAPVAGSLLLGQSFLSRFKSWSMDNQGRTLILN